MPEVPTLYSAFAIFIIAGSVTLSLAVALLPCFIIAKKNNFSASWWQWLVPFWNIYLAARLGRVPAKTTFSCIFLAAFLFITATLGVTTSFILKGVAMGTLVCIILFFYVLYVWLMHLGELAGVHKHFLPVMMLVFPLILRTLFEASFYFGNKPVTGEELVGSGISIGTWILFMIVAVRAPKDELQASEDSFYHVPD